MATRNTTTRDRNRRAIARGKPPCGICEQPIDYTLPHLDPMAFTIDHVIPLALGGPDDLGNLQAAHRKCNRDKWHKDKHEHQPEVRTFTTERTW